MTYEGTLASLDWIMFSAESHIKSFICFPNILIGYNRMNISIPMCPVKAIP